MISYKLGCERGHEFESWFANIAAFDRQVQSALIECPECGSRKIEKLPMAPAVVGTRKEQRQADATVKRTEFTQKLRAFRREVMENSEDVGPRFAEEARRIHDDEAPGRNIHGEATADEARALVEDGIQFGILPKLPEDNN